MTTWRYTIATTPDDRERLGALLHLAGARGVWERAGDLVAWFDGDDADVPAGGEWEVEPDHDWQEAWKAGLSPVNAGTIVVTPSWVRDEVPPGAKHIITLDPGQAFGTGHHATTTQCLELLQRLDLTGARVLDVGTGTGVLAIAAVLLGAGEVLGVDIDADAVAVAAANAEANGVVLDVREGSVDVADAPPYDVVLANLITPVIVDLAPSLVAATAEGGTLIASGIADERRGRAVLALEIAGLTVDEVVVRDGWVALTGRRLAT